MWTAAAHMERPCTVTCAYPPETSPHRIRRTIFDAMISPHVYVQPLHARVIPALRRIVKETGRTAPGFDGPIALSACCAARQPGVTLCAGMVLVSVLCAMPGCDVHMMRHACPDVNGCCNVLHVWRRRNVATPHDKGAHARTRARCNIRAMRIPLGAYLADGRWRGWGRGQTRVRTFRISPTPTKCLQF